MVHAATLRQQIDTILAQSSKGRLILKPRLERPGLRTGFDTLDVVLQGGLPIAGTSEIVGGRSSGRTTIAAAYLAERTREGYICAWVDVSAEMVPDASLADGVDLSRVLWVRCSGASEVESYRGPGSAVPRPQLVSGKMNLIPPVKPDIRPYNPTRKRIAGTPGAPNRLFSKASERVEQVNSDRAPARRGLLVVKKAVHTMDKQINPVAAEEVSFVKPKKPWSRLEQAIKAVDLLIQAGGFGAIVLDLGAVSPQFAQRIPLATWFRWRAAAERTRSSLVVLSQKSCTGSSAELVLRVEAEVPEQGTVLTGIEYRLQVVRRRFAKSVEAAEGQNRKQPQPATTWHSRITGAAS